MFDVPHLARPSRLCRWRPRPFSRRLPAKVSAFVFLLKINRILKLPGEPLHEGTATGHRQASRRTTEPPKTISRQTAARGNRAHPCRKGTRSLRQISDVFRPAQSVRFLTLGGIRPAFLAPSVRFLTLGGRESMHFMAAGPKYHGCPPSHSLISQLAFPPLTPSDI